MRNLIRENRPDSEEKKLQKKTHWLLTNQQLTVTVYLLRLMVTFRLRLYYVIYRLRFYSNLLLRV